jgi:uncharacterized membrane protein YkgB
MTKSVTIFVTKSERERVNLLVLVLVLLLLLLQACEEVPLLRDLKSPVCHNSPTEDYFLRHQSLLL